MFTKPVSQAAEYHCFADNITLFSIPNYWNVISNTGFVLSGIWGISILSKKPYTQWTEWSLMAGIVLTGIGSAYYHYKPDNWTLVWDRLPMTIVFSSFFAVLYSWYFSAATARYIGIAGIVSGIASVLYWYITEINGYGDLRPYGIVQFLPMVLTLLILVLHRTQHRELWLPLSLMLCWYIAAKAAEHYDHQVYELTNRIGGHPIKHLLASIATFYIVKTVKTSK